MELHCSAAPSYLWSCVVARLQAIRGAVLQCGSELNATLSVAAQLRTLQRRAVRGAALQCGSELSATLSVVAQLRALQRRAVRGAT